MAILDLRQRVGWLFMAVTVGHILLISAQVNTKRGVPVLEAVTFGTFAEVQRAATSGIASVRDVWSNYFALQEIRRENESLRDEVSKLRVGLQQERALAEQTRTLQQLLDLRSATKLTTAAAEVIAGGASPDFRTITISDEEIREALTETVNVIVDAVRVALERTPPELSADIVDRGIVLTGGGSMLKNLDKRLREETGLPLAMAEDPLSSVVLGAGKMLSDFNLLRKISID